MTNEEIFDLAKAAGMRDWTDDGNWSAVDDDLIRFAKSVAEAEREACAKVCESRYMGDNNREDMEARRCAENIRARSNA
jgi:hypothetical protein